MTGGKRRKKRKRFVLNSCSILHSTMVKYWEHEENEFLQRTRYKVYTRFDLAIYGSGLHGHACMGDQIVENIRNVFHDGFGIKWSEIQCEIFEIFLQACFPLIYGDDWP